MKPTNREEFKEYVLFELGSPVVEINIDEVQLENQIDKALEFFQEFHYLGTEKTFLKRKVTATRITVADTSGFEALEQIVVASGKMLTLHRIIDATTLEIVTKGLNLPVVGDTLLGESSGATGTITAVVYGDIDLGYVPVSEGVTEIVKVYPMSTSIYGAGIFDIRYQLRLNDLFDLYSTEMVYYTNVMQHLALIDHLLVTNKQFRFNRHTDRLYVDMDWKTAIFPDEYILAEAFVITDPDAYKKVWNDRMLKKLAVAYTKRMWAVNMKKYSGAVIIGGLTMNGQLMFEEAEQEIEKIEEQIRDTYSEPPRWCMG